MKSAVAVVVALAVGPVVGSSFVVADYVPVIGGPSYSAATGSGYQSGGGQLFFKLGISAGDGAAYAGQTKFSANIAQGAWPVRFDASGYIEFETLGSSSAGFGSTYISFTGPNASGMTAGGIDKYVAGTKAGQRPVRWDAAGHITELQYTGNLGLAAGGYARAINDAGTVVGANHIDQADGFGGYSVVELRPIRWAGGQTGATALDILPANGAAHTQTSADFINSAGSAFGTSVRRYSDAIVDTRAVRWDAGGTAATELGILGTDASGNASTSVQDMADNSYLAGVGTSYSAAHISLGRSAVRWNPDGSAVALARLGTGNLDYGWAVNTSGTVVGQSRLPGAPEGSTYGMRAVRWDAGGTAITQLGVVGTPTSTTGSWAHDINAAGIAVGSQRADANPNSGIAVMWGLDGVAIDLNTLIAPASGWSLTAAGSITDTNWVAGTGLFDPDGTGPIAAYDRAFLIHIPEPASLFGLLGGIGWTIAARRRKPAMPAGITLK